MLSRFSLGDSAARPVARGVTAYAHVTVCRPGAPGPVSVVTVSPLASTTLMRADVEPGVVMRYEIAAP